jgi:protein SCO1/2
MPAAQARPGEGVSPLKRVLGHPAAWVAAIVLVGAVGIVRRTLPPAPSQPARLLTLPEFELVAQTGQGFGSAQLRGQVWIANFIFTSCPTMCPELTRKMRSVRDRFRATGTRVHFVSFSVDPERDTPEKLKAYAEKYGADPSDWAFLTGTLGAVERAVVDGFKTPMDKDEASEDTNLFNITHGSRFVLVDRELGVRGFYEVDEPGLERLSEDTKRLIVD